MSPAVREIYETLRFGPDKPDVSLKHAKETSGSELSRATSFEKQNNDVLTHSASQSQSVATSSPLEPEPSDVFRSPTIHSISSKLHNTFRGQHRPANSWRPGFLQLRPLLGVFALLITVGSLFGSLVVLKVSDGQPTADWHPEPTVYLAILTALGNSALVLARTQALPISWWYHASRGSSVRRLQRHWEVGHSLFRAVRHLRNLSVLHMTCIACTFAIIDGALLQRSSTVVRATIASNITLDLVLPPELPQGFSGIMANGTNYLTTTVRKTTVDWTESKPIEYPTPQCAGTCTATVLAPGLGKRKCGPTKRWPVTLAMLSNKSASWGPWHGYAPLIGAPGLYARNPVLNSWVAGANHGFDPAFGEATLIQRGMADWNFNMGENGQGQYEDVKCLYSPAILQYNVVIQGGTIAIDGDASEAPVIRMANNTSPIEWNHYYNVQPTVMQRLQVWLAFFVQVNASVVLGPEMRYYEADPATWNRPAMHTTIEMSFTRMAFEDPTPRVIKEMNELMFRGAVLAGQTWSNISSLIDKGVSIYQSVAAEQKIEQNVYKTDLRYFAGAALLQLVAAGLVLQMYWGFWTLGIPVTLSPFGIALAFDAPLFANINSTAGVDGVVGQLGDAHLKFGVVDQPDGDGAGTAYTGRLGLAETENVRQPQKGVVFTK